GPRPQPDPRRDGDPANRVGPDGLDPLARRRPARSGRLRPRGGHRRLRPAAAVRRLRAPPGADPPRLLQTRPRRAGRQDLRASAPAGRPPGDPGAPLPARRGDPVRRLPRRLVQALAARGEPARRRVHPLLWRPLHGRERGHPLRTAPAGDLAEPRGRLLDGRHGQGRGRRGRLGGARRARDRRGRADHVHEFGGGAEGVLRAQRRDRLHLLERRPRLRLGVRAGREAVLLPRRAPRPQHRGQEGHPGRQDGRLGPVPAPRRQHPRAAARRDRDPLEGVLLGPRPLLGRADRAGPRRAPGRPRDRPPRVPPRGRPGRRQRRVDRVHPRRDPRRAGRHHLGGRDGDQHGQAAQRRAARQGDRLPRPGRLPLLDDVPRPPRLHPLGAGAPGRGRGRQPDLRRPDGRPRRAGRPRPDAGGPL
ncbi:MAG: Quinolinate synthetase, partial [uncultured Thermomicrobiales bacterium]